MSLNTQPNLREPGKRYFQAYSPGDDFYELLIDTHRDLTDEQSALLNARLILLLSNHIGDLSVLREAMTLARVLNNKDVELFTASYAVPGSFTREAWDKYFRNAIAEASRGEVKGDDWVLAASLADDLSRAGFAPQVVLPRGGRGDVVVWRHGQAD